MGDSEPSKKRYRQTSLADCFGFKKVERKPVTSDWLKKMEQRSIDEREFLKKRELMLQAAEKRLSIPNSSAGNSKMQEIEERKSESQETIDLDDIDFSQELFSDTQSSSADPSQEEEKIPEDFSRTPDCCSSLPKLEPGPEHTIFFRPYLDPARAPRPFPDNYIDKWDGDHVRMPCSPENIYPVEQVGGSKCLKSRWEIIRKALSEPIKSSYDLQAAILKYNEQYAKQWDFKGLHALFEKMLDPAEADAFFDNILPKLAKLALDLPNIITQPIPLLKRHRMHALTFSQKQLACLLANAFFCTFPRRNSQKRNAEYAFYPDINLNRLFFSDGKNGRITRRQEKLKCLLNYFRRICSKEPVGVVTFHRRFYTKLPEWKSLNHPLRRIHVQSKGFIEQEGKGMLQVDFANKFVGGGVLGLGCVQEEIRFITCPELIVSRLFTEKLDASEVLLISGAEQYNEHSGYADNFLWAGDHQDQTPRDSWGRRYTQIVAMDALHFRRSEEQFKPDLVKRELNKAYCGFFEPDTDPHHLSAVATGNWGCGAFKGDACLKSLIQLMAASVVQRDLVYFSFGNDQLKNDIQAMYEFLIQKGALVGEIYGLFEKYFEECISPEGKSLKPLYDYIYCSYNSYDSSTDADSCTENSQRSQDSVKILNDLIDEDDEFKGMDPG